MKHKAILIPIITLLLLVVLLVSYSYANAQYPRFEHQENEEETAAVYPYREGVMYIGDSIRFRIDTGSLVSTILPTDVALLERRGIEIDSGWFPSLARSIHGDLYVTTKRYKASLPIRARQLNVDAESGRGEYTKKGPIVNRINNIIFLPASKEDTISTLGVDFLERFVVEYQWGNHAIAFRREVPKEYQYVTEIKKPFSPISLLGMGSKYYVELNVENSGNDYRLDTGLRGIDLKLPPRDTLNYIGSGFREGRLETSRGSYPAYYSDSVWVKLGNRQGSHGAVYGDDGDDSYGFNPLEFYEQDFVIDFPGRKLYLHPRSADWKKGSKK